MRGVSRRLAASLVLLACTAQAAGTAVDDAYLASGGDGSDWPAYGRTSTEQRYSPLDQINAGNVKDLGIQWVTELPDERSLIATPLAVDGVIYFTGSYSRTYAVDARTGKVIWTFDPKSIEHAGDRLRIMWDINRGPAYYKGKVIISTVDGRLVAIDAETGKQLWETMTVDPRKSYYVNGAPKVFRDKVIIGNGGTEHEAARGYVTAYDVEFNQVLIGTGNGSPWNQKIRSPGGAAGLRPAARPAGFQDRRQGRRARARTLRTLLSVLPRRRHGGGRPGAGPARVADCAHAGCLQVGGHRRCEGRERHAAVQGTEGR